MIYFQIYLISCIPALWTVIWSVYEDIQCHRGKKKPDHKFGYNWQWPQWFGFTQILIVAQLMPVANLYFGWIMWTWIAWDAAIEKYK